MHILDDYSLSQHVKVPTRPAFGKTLDLLLSTYPNSVSNVFMSSGLRDHLAVIFEINLKPLRSTKPPHKAYIYKKANFDGLNDFISKSSSEFFASNPCGNPVEQNWNSFKHAVTTGISQFIPQKSSKPKFSLPWITPKIKREMRKKKIASTEELFEQKTNITGKLSNANVIPCPILLKTPTIRT